MTASDFIQGFHDLDLEVADVPLPVHGRLPAWLRGTLFRNGPACFTAGAVHLRHWFDGFAMLHRIVMGDGPVSYSNRFLGSRSRLYAQRHGRLGYRTFTTDPARGWPTRIRDYLFPNPGDNGLVSLIRHRGELLALTESTPQLRVDPVFSVISGYRSPQTNALLHERDSAKSAATSSTACPWGEIVERSSAPCLPANRATTTASA